MMLESMLWLNTPSFVARFLEDRVLPAVGAPMAPLGPKWTTLVVVMPCCPAEHSLEARLLQMQPVRPYGSKHSMGCSSRGGLCTWHLRYSSMSPKRVLDYSRLFLWASAGGCVHQ